MLQFLETMRQAREQQGLDIEALARRTRIRAHQLEAVEQGRFDLLPRGVYARAVVRAYASAVGLEPNNAVAQVAALLPDAEDPMQGIARVHGYAPPSRDVPAVAQGPVDPPDARSMPARLSAGEPPRREAIVGTDAFPRALAAAIDALFLAAIDLGLLAVSVRAAGLPTAELLEFGAPALLMLATLIAALYFLLLGGIAGATVGSRLLRLDFRGPAAVTLSTACRRAAGVAARELSIGVDLALPLVRARLAAGTRGARRSDTPWEETAPVP